MTRVRSTSALFAATALALVGALAPAASASPTTVCVGHGPGCHSSIQAGVNAAHPGDTVLLGPGTFAGSVEIDKSIRLSGAGAGATRIAGGGPVLTLGAPDSASEPAIHIDHLSVMRGKTSSSADGGNVALGGGIYIPAGKDGALGATVTIADAVVADNEAAPRSTVPSNNASCPGGPCPFALAAGGGIASFGTLTLNRVTVSGNRADGLASDADGGGIYSGQGDLNVSASVITGNRAIASVPNGRFAEGGGVMVQGGTLSVRASVVKDNSASLTSRLPSFAGSDLIDMNANAGGIHVGDGVPTRVSDSILSGNSVSAVDPNGEPAAIDAAMIVNDSPLTMSNTQIVGNDVRAIYASSEDVGIGGSILEADGGGEISGSRIVGNSSSATSQTGVAAVSGGLAVFNFSDHPPQLLRVHDSVIDSNRASSTSSSGSADTRGVGVLNNSLLELRHVEIGRNSGTASAPAGGARGGGIWNGVDLSGPPVELSLIDALIDHNDVIGRGGASADGGGVLTTSPIARTHTTIVDNQPNQCTGC